MPAGQELQLQLDDAAALELLLVEGKLIYNLYMIIYIMCVHVYLYSMCICA